MKAEEFRKEIRKILESDIKFDGYVDLVIDNTDEDRQRLIIDWVKQCKAGTKKPEPCKKFRNLMAFIYKSNDNKIRGILTKEKSAYFIELFLGKHKYYGQKRRYLGL